jgi:hypothetical protein
MAKNPVLEDYVKETKDRIRKDPDAFIEQCRRDVETCTRAIHGCLKLLDLFENPPEGFNRDKVVINLTKTMIQMAEMNRNSMAIGMIVASSSKVMFDELDMMGMLDDIVQGKKKGG